MRNRLAFLVGTRQPRPHLSLLAVPLAMTAAGLSDAWPLVFLLPLFAWYWASSGQAAWIAVQLGIFGIEWAAVGAVCLGRLRDHRWLVAAGWIAVPVLLASVACHARRQDPGRGW